jgi:hypothetical protein
LSVAWMVTPIFMSFRSCRLTRPLFAHFQPRRVRAGRS